MPKKKFPPREYLVLLSEDELNDLISACVRRIGWAESQIDRYDIDALSGDSYATDMVEWFGDELKSLRDAIYWLRNAEKLDADRSNADEE